MNSSKDIILLADRIKYKPMSVNKAWQGKRFKTQDYSAYEKDMLTLLKNRQLPFGNKPMEIYLKFGFSNSASDVDNCVKPFVDILQKKYKFNDKFIYRMVVEKVLVPKGDDFIEYRLRPLPQEYFAAAENSLL